MNQMFFSIHFRKLTQLGFFFVCVYLAFTVGAAANDKNCPKMDDHSISAVRYQLFTAFQVGYDGYQTPCDLKCMGKEKCTESCRVEKGLASLEIQFDKLKVKKNLISCPSYTVVCIEQCQQHGEPCNRACGVGESVAVSQ